MKHHSEAAAVAELLTRGVEKVEVADHLSRRLAAGERLRVKFGVDPTAADLHLGHAVVLRKLRRFQEIGHHVILLIGDFTATIGDPSGRSEARPMLSASQIEENWRDYERQAGKIIDLSAVELRRNHEWYERWSLANLLELYAKFTVSRVLERDDFQKRLSGGGELSMLELAYPVLQGYDSFELHADVELGGSDQLFNMLMGRKVQRRLGQEPQDVLATTLLEGTDGTRKMSKSYQNYIGLGDSAEDAYGKLMSLPDHLIGRYLRLLTDTPEGEVAEQERGLADGSQNPRQAKASMAEKVVSWLCGAAEASAAAERFDAVHRRGQVPDALPEAPRPAGPISPVELLVTTGLASSRSAARRLIEQGGVKLDGVTIADPLTPTELRAGTVVTVGKRTFLRLV